MRSPLRPTSLRLAGMVGALAIGLAACGGTDATTDQPTDSAPATDTPATDSPASDEPTDDTPAVEGDCSAVGVELPEPDLAGLPEPTRATALFLLDAALRCDEQLLFTAATEGRTRLTFGNAEPGEFLALPEPEGQPVYEVIARLIAGTTVAEADGAEIWVFPAVTTGNGTDADWRSLVTAGLYTQAEADQLRAAGDGYLGWRLGIDTEGNWTFLVQGD